MTTTRSSLTSSAITRTSSPPAPTWSGARYGLKLARVTPVPDVEVRADLWKEHMIQPFQNYFTVSLGIPFPIWDRNQGNIMAAAAAMVRAAEGPHAAEVTLTTNLATAYATYKNNLFAMDYYRRNILPDQVRYYRGVFERRRIDPNAAFGDLVQAQQMLVADVTAYLGILGSLWTSVVGVADFLQTDDLYQLGKPLALPELPDLDDAARLAVSSPSRDEPEAAEVRTTPTPVPHAGAPTARRADSAANARPAERQAAGDTGVRRHDARVESRPAGPRPGPKGAGSQAALVAPTSMKAPREQFDKLLGVDEPSVRRSDFRGGPARCASVRTSHAGPFAALERGKLNGRCMMIKITHLLLAGAVALRALRRGPCAGDSPAAARRRTPPTRERSPTRSLRKRASRSPCQAVQTPALARGSWRRCHGRATRRAPCSDRNSPPRRAASGSMLRISSPTRCSTPRSFRPRAGLPGRRFRSSSRTSSPIAATACSRASSSMIPRVTIRSAANATTVNLPAAPLDWTASPRVFAGYRLPSGFGEFMVAYRHLGTTGSGSVPDTNGPDQSEQPVRLRHASTSTTTAASSPSGPSGT